MGVIQNERKQNEGDEVRRAAGTGKAKGLRAEIISRSGFESGRWDGAGGRGGWINQFASRHSAIHQNNDNVRIAIEQAGAIA